MKVKILQRSVYYKTTELEIEVDENDFQDYLRVNNAPKGAIAQDYMSDYLIDNEDLWVDEIDQKLNESEFIFGFGMDTDYNWTDKDQESELRYECDELKIGGHL